MKLLKRTLCLMLVLLTIGSLCACSGSSVELAKTKLEDAYNTCCKGSKTEYAELGYDGMSLTIDTDPYDYGYSKYAEDAIAAIQDINLYLGLPASLLEKIFSTRALDGTLTQNCGTYTATWTYHPDNGLKVIYEVNP